MVPAVVGLCFLAVPAIGQVQEEAVDVQERDWTWRLESAWAALRGVSPEPRFRLLFRRHVDRGYLQTLGPTPLRFGVDDSFNRHNLVRLDTILVPKLGGLKELEVEVPEEPEVLTDLPADEETAEVPQATVTPADGGTSTSAVSIPQRIVDQNVITPPTQGVVVQETMPAIDPRLVLQFFEPSSPSGPTSASVEVPFVMPFQSSPPLIMESEATYQQTGSSSQ